MDLISPSQCRAARGLLKWTQPDLAGRCGIHIQTICAFENETGTPTKKTLQKITVTFEKEGVELLEGHGVKIFNTNIRILHGDEGIMALFDDIYESVIPGKGDILIANNTERLYLASHVQDYLDMHLKRLEKSGIKERILCSEGDTNFLGPKTAYRWVPKEFFCDIPTFIYAGKLAMLIWGPPAKVTIINDPQYAESLRNLFNFAWHNARIPQKV